MDLFLQRCFDGLFNGAIYASLALAIVMLFRSTGLLNFALGEIGMVGGYVSLVMLSSAGAATTAFSIPIVGTDTMSRLPGHPYPVPVAVLAGVVVSGLLGVAIQQLIMRRIDGRSNFVTVNAAIALLIALGGLTVEIWGGRNLRFAAIFPDAPSDFVDVFGGRLRYTTIGAWLLQLAVITFIAIMLKRTKLGLAFRATTSNREAAALMGINVNRTLAIAWGLSSALAGLTAALVAASTILRPGMMLQIMILSFAAATIGGLDSAKGAIVGGLIVAVAQTFVPGYTPFPSELAVVPPFVVMTALLMFRPQGLFGTAKVARV